MKQKQKLSNRLCTKINQNVSKVNYDTVNNDFFLCSIQFGTGEFIEWVQLNLVGNVKCVNISKFYHTNSDAHHVKTCQKSSKSAVLQDEMYLQDDFFFLCDVPKNSKIQ